MDEPLAVILPLINPNEPEAKLMGLHVKEGQHVDLGELICTLETTKSTLELEAEVAGFVTGLRYVEGDTVRAGEILCYLSESSDWIPAKPVTHSLESQSQILTQDIRVPEGLRITKPALSLAHERGIDLSNFPVGPLVTEEMVRTKLMNVASTDYDPPKSEFDPTAVVVYGCGGHGKSLVDLLLVQGIYNIVGFIDDGVPAGEEIMGLPVLGGYDILEDLYTQGVRLAVNAVGGIGDVGVRIEVFERLAQVGFTCPAVTHPTAFIEPEVEVSPGVQIFPQAYVGSEVTIGFGSIINTGAIVSHECVLGNYVNLSPGCILAGGVQVGDGVLIGMGATINLRVRIGAGARIGNGATVKMDVPEDGLVRAGAIWPQ